MEFILKLKGSLAQKTLGILRHQGFIIIFYNLSFFKSRTCFQSLTFSHFPALFLHYRSKREREIQRDRLDALCIWIQGAKNQVQKAVCSYSQLWRAQGHPELHCRGALSENCRQGKKKNNNQKNMYNIHVHTIVKYCLFYLDNSMVFVYIYLYIFILFLF